MADEVENISSQPVVAQAGEKVLRLEREEKVILEPDERGDQGESQKKDQKKYQS